MHVVITGASSGIGAALARELGRAGHGLTLVARRRALLDALAKEPAIANVARVRVVELDLSQPDRATSWIADAEAELGPIDVLVNNAGMENTGPSAEADPDELRKLLDLNLVTPLLMTRAVLPSMIARKSGAVVNVSSVAALVAPPMQAYYGASKAGLAMFSETLRGELAGTGVQVLTVYPGPIATPMGDAAAEKFGGRDKLPSVPEGQPDELARLIARAMQRNTARVIYPYPYTASRWFGPLARALVNRFAPRRPLR
ncbi:MAG: SDR family NAD(P)-dependent oxidoreductase [Kofleriaceae bacterium]